MREPCFFFYCYARLQRYYKSCLLAVELLLVTIYIYIYMAVCNKSLPLAPPWRPCTKPCTEKNTAALYGVDPKRPCTTTLYDNLVRNLVRVPASGS